jgi:hypothetical protein
VLGNQIDLSRVSQMLGVGKVLHAQILALTVTEAQQLLCDDAGRLSADGRNRAIANATAVYAVTGRAIGEQRLDLISRRDLGLRSQCLNPRRRVHRLVPTRHDHDEEHDPSYSTERFHRFMVRRRARSREQHGTA